ncbi:MAG TPA: aminotransferase class IV [Phycisphaerae bacterium]|nr:aminotransferase class IV [Phycisphaerae bacterium]
MNPRIYLNGRMVEASKAVVPASNPSLLHGVGLFETLRTYEGRPFALERHIERMKVSAARLNMPVQEVIDKVPDAVAELIEANRLKNARIRFTVAPPGQIEPADVPTILVAGQETAGYAQDLYERGMTVYVCTDYRQSRQDPLAGHKTTSYFSRLLVLRDGQDRGCGEALWFTPENLLAEGCISNVFIVKDGRLRTPPLDTPVLPGITRAVTIELARAAGIKVDESSCTINDLLGADEIFLTNAIMEIMPVTRIEKKAIGDEKPGTITKKLADTFRDLVAQVP